MPEQRPFVARDQLLAAISEIRIERNNVVPFSVVRDLKLQLITEALRVTRGNVHQAAQLLGIGRDKIRYQIKTLHLRHLTNVRSS